MADHITNITRADAISELRSKLLGKLENPKELSSHQIGELLDVLFSKKTNSSYNVVDYYDIDRYYENYQEGDLE